MIALPARVRKISIESGLLAKFFKAGTVLDKLVVSVGLPDDAKIEAATFDVVRDRVILYCTSAEFDVVSSPTAIPSQQVTWQREYVWGTPRQEPREIEGEVAKPHKD